MGMVLVYFTCTLHAQMRTLTADYCYCNPASCSCVEDEYKISTQTRAWSAQQVLWMTSDAMDDDPTGKSDSRLQPGAVDHISHANGHGPGLGDNHAEEGPVDELHGKEGSSEGDGDFSDEDVSGAGEGKAEADGREGRQVMQAQVEPAQGESAPGTRQSAHEKRLARMAERIARMEETNMAERDWWLQGEAGAGMVLFPACNSISLTMSSRPQCYENNRVLHDGLLANHQGIALPCCQGLTCWPTVACLGTRC